MLRATGHYVALISSLLCSPMSAAGQNVESASSVEGQSLPAVDGLNAKASGFSGTVDERAHYGGAGHQSTLPI